MRRNLGSMAMLGAMVLAVVSLVAAPMAWAQDTNEIVRELEATGYYIEAGGDATDSEMRSLVNQGNATSDSWYFVVLSGPAEPGYAATIRDQVRPLGNVLVHSIETDAEGAFDQVDFATGSTEAIEERSLAAFDTNWARPADYMDDVIVDFTAATAGSGSSGGSAAGSSNSSDSGGGGFPWGWVAVPAVLGGGVWFLSRRGKKKKQDDDLETAQKIRTELQSEIDELANDVLVLSVLSICPISHRPSSSTVRPPTPISTSPTRSLSSKNSNMPIWLSCRSLALVSPMHGGRWMRSKPSSPASRFLKNLRSSHRRHPQLRRCNAPRNSVNSVNNACHNGRRVLASRTARRDVATVAACSTSSYAGAGTMAGSRSRGRSGGGMFGGGSRGRSSGGGMFGGGSRQTQSRPRPGGGVFGGSSRSRTSGRSSSNRSGRASTSRRSSSSSRRSSSGRSTTKRRRR